MYPAPSGILLRLERGGQERRPPFVQAPCGAVPNPKRTHERMFLVRFCEHHVATLFLFANLSHEPDFKLVVHGTGCTLGLASHLVHAFGHLAAQGSVEVRRVDIKSDVALRFRDCIVWRDGGGRGAHRAYLDEDGERTGQRFGALRRAGTKEASVYCKTTQLQRLRAERPAARFRVPADAMPWATRLEAKARPAFTEARSANAILDDATRTFQSLHVAAIDQVDSVAHRVLLRIARDFIISFNTAGLKRSLCRLRAEVDGLQVAPGEKVWRALYEHAEGTRRRRHVQRTLPHALLVLLGCGPNQTRPIDDVLEDVRATLQRVRELLRGQANVALHFDGALHQARPELQATLTASLSIGTPGPRWIGRSRWRTEPPRAHRTPSTTQHANTNRDNQRRSNQGDEDDSLATVGGEPVVTYVQTSPFELPPSPPRNLRVPIRQRRVTLAEQLREALTIPTAPASSSPREAPTGAPGALLSTREAARLAGRSPKTIRRWIREGQLSSAREGRQHRVHRSELDTLIGCASPGDE